MGDDHDDACYLWGLKLQHKGYDDDSSCDERNEDIVLCVPFLAGHLLQQDIVVRIIDLKSLPVASHGQTDQHHHDLDDCEDCQHQSEDLQAWFSAYRGDLNETREEKDIEDKSNDTGWEDDLFPADENSCGVVRNPVGKDQQHPEDT